MKTNEDINKILSLLPSEKTTKKGNRFRLVIVPDDTTEERRWAIRYVGDDGSIVQRVDKRLEVAAVMVLEAMSRKKEEKTIVIGKDS